MFAANRIMKRIRLSLQWFCDIFSDDDEKKRMWKYRLCVRRPYLLRKKGDGRLEMWTKACKYIMMKFLGWEKHGHREKQRGRERCVSAEVARAFRCDLWRERRAFHLNSARFSGEDIDQNEMWSVAMERMNESWRDRGGGEASGWGKKEEREGGGLGAEDEAALIINVLNSPVMPQK